MQEVILSSFAFLKGHEGLFVRESIRKCGVTNPDDRQ
jgi:hypothetical protein